MIPGTSITHVIHMCISAYLPNTYQTDVMSYLLVESKENPARPMELESQRLDCGPCALREMVHYDYSMLGSLSNSPNHVHVRLSISCAGLRLQSKEHGDIPDGRRLHPDLFSLSASESLLIMGMTGFPDQAGTAQMCLYSKKHPRNMKPS